MDEIDLAAPVDLAQDGLANEGLVVLADVGAYGQPLLGWSVYGAHISHAGQRHVQRAWDGRGCQRQDIHFLAHLFEALFVCDAKALFLVDDEQSKVLEGNVLGQEPVGADDDVHAPGSQAHDDPFLFLAGEESREHPDRDGEGTEAFGKGLVVLLGQDGGGYQHGHLFPIHDCFEGRPQSYFSLAIAHVATNEAIHGARKLHVRLDLLQGADLGIRFYIGEGCFQLGLP